MGKPDYFPGRLAAADSQEAAAAPAAETLGASSAVAALADPERIKEAVGRINQTVQSLVSQLEFTIDADTNMSVVKVIDTRTKEVLRQFPSEEVLQIAKALDNFTGLLLREKA